MPPKRRRPENRSLPARWRWNDGAYRYRVPKGMEHRWGGKTEFRLGRTLSEAYKTWAARMGDDADRLQDMNGVFDRYLLEALPDKAPATQRSNRRSIEQLRPVFGAMQPCDIKPAHAYKYFDLCAKQRGKTTAKHDIQVLRHTLTKCVEWGEIDANPLLRQIRLKGTSVPRARLVEEWEVQAAIGVKDLGRVKKDGTRQAPSRGVLICALYLELKNMVGQRRCDILRLRMSDLRDEGIHFRPSKTASTTGAAVIIQWDDRLRDLIERIKAVPPRRIGNAPLFVTREGEPYIGESDQANGFDSIWQRFMDKVMELTPVQERFQERDIRAKVATGSDSLIEAMERLAHSSPETTKRVYRRKPAVVSALHAKKDEE